ncbi:hypothetical protein [Aquibacillus halophilus]|nr:hypothetical protein [Aquibacillus halophilus]
MWIKIYEVINQLIGLVGVIEITVNKLKIVFPNTVNVLGIIL